MRDTIELRKLLIPTPTERAYGRFLRAPDHDAGTADAGADAGDAGAEGEAGDEESLLGDAGATEGAQGEAEGAQEGAEGEQGAEEGLPETYELTPPEGYDAIDEELLAEATPLFKELGLGNEQVQLLVPLVPKIEQRILGAQADAFNQTSAQWAKEAKADPNIGGAKWDETVHFMGKALDVAAAKLPTITQKVDGKDVEITGKDQVDQFRELLKDTRLGNHPVMVRMFRLFGEQVGEDNEFIRADGAAQVKRPREAVLYPHDVNNQEGTE